MNMHATLIDLLTAVQSMQKETKDYREQLGEWKKAEHAVALKARNEQQACAKRLA